MNKNENDNRNLIIENLNNDSPTDTQIIEMLLLLLDDWEVRSAVMQSVRNREEKKPMTTQTITQTVRGDTDHEK